MTSALIVCHYSVVAYYFLRDSVAVVEPEESIVAVGFAIVAAAAVDFVVEVAIVVVVVAAVEFVVVEFAEFVVAIATVAAGFVVGFAAVAAVGVEFVVATVSAAAAIAKFVLVAEDFAHHSISSSLFQQLELLISSFSFVSTPPFQPCLSLTGGLICSQLQNLPNGGW